MREHGFPLIRIVPYKDRIVDSALIHENTGQHPTNTPRGFNVEATWKRVSTSFQRGIHMVCLQAIFLHTLRGEYLHLSQFFFTVFRGNVKVAIFLLFVAKNIWKVQMLTMLLKKTFCNQKSCSRNSENFLINWLQQPGKCEQMIKKVSRKNYHLKGMSLYRARTPSKLF